MKRITTWALGLLLTLLAVSAADPPRGPRGGRGWGPDGQYCRMYNSAAVETLKGEVVRIEKFTPGKGMSAGVHLELKTEKETISVHLGPGWYINNQETQIALNDNIDVKGSRITFDGQPAIVAAEVTKGNDVLKLRDEHGFPVWAGWRRR